MGPTGSVGRSMEYILCRLAEGLSSDTVGERTGLPWRPPASGDMRPAVITQERFPAIKNFYTSLKIIIIKKASQSSQNKLAKETIDE